MTIKLHDDLRKYKYSFRMKDLFEAEKIINEKLKRFDSLLEKIQELSLGGLLEIE